MTDPKVHYVDGHEVSEYGFLTFKYWQWWSKFAVFTLTSFVLVGGTAYCIGYFLGAYEVLHNSPCLQQQVKK